MRARVFAAVLLASALADGQEDSGKAILLGVKRHSQPNRGALELYRADIPKQSMHALIGGERDGPGGGFRPGDAFYLVERTDEHTGVLRWVLYFTANGGFEHLHDYYYAETETLPDDDNVYVVVFHARPIGGRLMAYRIDPRAEVGDLPVRLPPEKGQPWPKQVEPIAEVEWSWTEGTGSGLAGGAPGRLTTLSNSKGILASVQVGREPMYWRFDSNSSRWMRSHVKEDASK